MNNTTDQDRALDNPNSSPYLTTKEACQFLRVGRTKLSDLLNKKALHCSRNTGKILIKRKDCSAFIEFGESAWRYLNKRQKQTIGDYHA